MKIRSFLAFDVSQKVRQALNRLIGDFSRKEPAVSWLPAENLHVTMKFFGDVEESLLLGDVSRAIVGVTDREQPVKLDCAGLGVFPNWKYPRVIWAGFIGDSEPLLKLHEKIETVLADFPLKEDRRGFRLHMTIGRAKELKSTGNLMNLINELGPINFGEVVIDHLTLYKSVLTKSGSIYTALKVFNFGE